MGFRVGKRCSIWKKIKNLNFIFKTICYDPRHPALGWSMEILIRIQIFAKFLLQPTLRSIGCDKNRRFLRDSEHRQPIQPWFLSYHNWVSTNTTLFRIIVCFTRRYLSDCDGACEISFCFWGQRAREVICAWWSWLIDEWTCATESRNWRRQIRPPFSHSLRHF